MEHASILGFHNPAPPHGEGKLQVQEMHLLERFVVAITVAVASIILGY